MLYSAIFCNFAPNMVRFLALGSGSSGNAYLLMTNDDNLMIDAGIGIRKLKKHFVANHMRLESLQRILITHDHADHVKSVGYVSAENSIPVYATKTVHEGIYKNYCVKKKIALENQHSIVKDETIQLGSFSITPFHVPHDSLDNVGYRIEVEGIVFSIITDCGYVTDRIAEVIGETNYLVLEANHDREMLMNGVYPQFLKERVSSNTGHLSNAQCAEALVNHATPALRHVWLCHLSEENNHPELARKTVEATLKSSGIIAGKDFMLDVLKRKSPSEVFVLE